ncbi:MAG: DNA-binding response regulator [Caldilinea sp. CFX5]|nr:DNA-binding response regulator [Caldilinea sp. CFX5]
MIKVLVVDDQPQVRRGLRMTLALEPKFVVVGEAGDGQEALRLASALQPDVIIMDVEMPGSDIATILKSLSMGKLNTIVIILSIHDDPATQERVYAAGATAFVSKRESPERLIAAIRAHIRG